MVNESISFFSSNLSDMINLSTKKSISIYEIIQDYAQQIDQKIVLICCFILFYFVMINFVVPISKKGFENNKYLSSDLSKMIFERFISLSETFAMGSAIMIVIFALIQYGFNDLSLKIKLFLIFNGIFAILSLLYLIFNIINFFKNKKEIKEDQKNKDGNLGN